MSFTSVKWAVAGAVRSLTVAILDLRGRARRRPVSTRALPRPRGLRRGEPSLRLTHALIGCDLNRAYLDFWPLARDAWAEVVGLEPLLVLVAEEGQVPPELAGDPAVHLFDPVPGVHTAFQAQCIRLLYPALLEIEGAVVISDADMAPMSRRYFTRPTAHIPASHFLAYRDAYMGVGEIPICYNAAAPATWGAVFGVRTPADVRARLTELGREHEYAGARGAAGWTTDQRLLHRSLAEYAHATRAVWVLDDHYTRYRRLERSSFRNRPELPERTREEIGAGRYTDFHCAHPFDRFREVNRAAVELAVKAQREPA